MLERQRHRQPHNTHDAHRKHCDDGGHPHITAAAQRAGKDFNADIGHIHRHQVVHHLHSLRHHGIVRAEQPEQQLGRRIQRQADAKGGTRRHGKAGHGAAAHAVILACAKVLARKGGNGNAKGADRHPEQEVDLAVHTPCGNGNGAKPIDGALDGHVADAVQRALCRARQADAADRQQHAAFNADIFELQMPRHALGAMDAPHCQHGADHLAGHRGNGRAGHPQRNDRHQHNIQHNVDDGSHDQKVQRPFGIAHRAQDVGAHVVNHLRNHAQKVNLQILGRHTHDFIRRLHQAQHRAADEQADHRQRRAARNGKGQCRVHLAVHFIVVPRAKALGNNHPRAAAQAHKKPHQQLHKRAGCPHSRQRLGTHKVADDQGIHRIVQLLEHGAQPDGKEE